MFGSLETKCSLQILGARTAHPVLLCRAKCCTVDVPLVWRRQSLVDTSKPVKKEAQICTQPATPKPQKLQAAQKLMLDAPNILWLSIIWFILFKESHFESSRILALIRWFNHTENNFISCGWNSSLELIEPHFFNLTARLLDYKYN